MRPPPYRWLAEYYDELFRGFRVCLDIQREHVLEPILPRVSSACDLACGTGTTALGFARATIATYALDVSPAMCRLTREKAARAGLRLHVIRADMRSFRLPKPVDLITCEGDALNHLPRKADLEKVAKAVARALRPGGHFYFDVNNARGFMSYWTSTVCLERPGVVVVMRNGHSPRADKAWSDIDWFIRDKSCWRRHSERIEEVCWSAGEIRRTFRENGFDRIRSWDAAPFWKANPLVRPGCRTVYLTSRSA